MTLSILAAVAASAARAEADATGTILQRYADDYALDPSLAVEHRFGVRVGERWWSVTALPSRDGTPAAVRVTPGQPAEPTYFFTTDEATLARVDRGELNALTAMGKARESDAAPMDIDVMPGFQPGPDFVGDLLGVAFHFWTRGLPERIPYSGDMSRTVHGAQAVVFYYQPGFRSAWFQIRPGQHANADPKDQSNPFPTLFIATRGRAKGKIGGVEVELDHPQAIFVPPGTPHEFWNPYDEPAEGILIMFGDGA